MKIGTIQAIQSLFEELPVKRYKRGHVFLLPGELSQYTYYLLEGKVKVYDVNYRGDEIIIDSFGSPTFFPLSMVFLKTPTKYIYEADTDIAVQAIDCSEVLRFLRSKIDLMLDLHESLYKGINGILERLIYAISATAKMRLVYVIVAECRNFGIYGMDGISLLTNEKELAQKAGLSRETVNREIKTLKSRTLLDVYHNKIVVRNLPALEQLLA